MRAFTQRFCGSLKPSMEMKLKGIKQPFQGPRGQAKVLFSPLANGWLTLGVMALFRYCLEKLTMLLIKPNSGCFACVCVQLVPLRPEKGRTPWSWSQMSISCCQVLGVRWGPGESCTCTVHSYFLLSYLRQLVSFLCLPLLSFSSLPFLPASLRSSCGLLR